MAIRSVVLSGNSVFSSCHHVPVRVDFPQEEEKNESASGFLLTHSPPDLLRCRALAGNTCELLLCVPGLKKSVLKN